MKRFAGLALLACLLIGPGLLAGCGAGESGAGTGSIDGYVYIPIPTAAVKAVPEIIVVAEATPPSGHEPLEGAVVRVVGTTLQDVTDSRGFYRISAVPVGFHTILVEAAGFPTFGGTLIVVEHQTTHALEPPPGVSVGSIDLSSSPSGARIWVDGEDTALVTPKTLTSVATGSRAVTLVLSTYVDWHGAAAVLDGQTASVSATLTLVADVVLANTAWPKFHADLRNVGLSPYIGSQAGTFGWRFQAGFGVASSPAIGSDGTVYVGSDDSCLYAINPDGTQKWRFQTAGPVQSSPAIRVDGTVYVGSQDGYLYAINPDGTQQWRFQAGSSVYSSPVIAADGTVYVGSWDSNLYAVYSDGTEKWRFLTGNPVGSSPAIGSDGTVYAGSQDGYVYAINPDGTQKWRFQTGDQVYSSPALGADGTVYVGSADHYLYAIN